MGIRFFKDGKNFPHSLRGAISSRALLIFAISFFIFIIILFGIFSWYLLSPVSAAMAAGPNGPSAMSSGPNGWRLDGGFGDEAGEEIDSANFKIATDPEQTVRGRAASASYQIISGSALLPPATKLAERTYRFYENIDAITPLVPRAAENEPLQNVFTGAIVRLRIAVMAAIFPLPQGKIFKLQFAPKNGGTCAAIPSGNFVDVSDSAIWRGFDNPSVADGAQLPGALLSTSAARETYEEQNNTAPTPAVIPLGLRCAGEWDWVIQNNGAVAGQNYCFRMVWASGAPLDIYLVYPEARAAAPRLESTNWRWYDDEEKETPTAALAGENITPQNLNNENIIKLRLGIHEAASLTMPNTKIALEYSEISDFSGDVYAVTEISDCAASSTFCYADGADRDNDPIQNRLLSDTNVSGAHNESGISSSTFSLPAGKFTEFEFTVKSVAPAPDTTYFFRAREISRNLIIPAAAGKNPPSVTTRGTKLIFTISGVAAGMATEGIITTVSTTPTAVPMNLPAPGESVAALRLGVETNAANGYQIFVFARSPLAAADGSIIGDTRGTNEAPAGWGIPAGEASAFGYHSGDDVLSGGSVRFAPDDTYARFASRPEEIAYKGAPAMSGEYLDFIFRLGTTAGQPAGEYGSAIGYIIVPTF